MRDMIQLGVLDPMLYGAARAFEYLGIRGQDMLDRIGDGIIEYGLGEGYFEKANDPHQFVGNVVKFFLQNGYMSDISVSQSGDTLDISMWNWRFLPLMRKLRIRNSYLLTCPVCMANNAITKSAGGVSERISENVTPNGIYTMKVKIVPGTTNTESTVIPLHPADLTQTKINDQLNESVGLHAFETVAYGLACGFDYLGAQAQLILDNIGTGMLEFMREESNLKLPADVEGSLETLCTFMASRGLADTIRVQFSQTKVDVDFRNYHYLPVLKRLLERGRNLVSCPFTLTARAVIRDKGLRVGDMRWQVGTNDAQLTMTTLDADKQQFDENTVSRMMGPT
jgi:hypothetical protein